MVRVAIAGAGGRMGKTLIQAVQDDAQMSLAAAFEHDQHPQLGQDAGELAGVGSVGVALSSDVKAHLDAFDVAIDFTVPVGTLALAKACVDQGKGLVVGTTGFSDEQLAELKRTRSGLALFMAPNMSPGVNLVFKLIEIAAKSLGDSVDVEIIETHHRHKIDAPSGTAVRMGEVLADALDRDLATDAVYGRQGITGARERQTIGFSALRGGDVVGEHTVMFAADGERIEITHRAQSRMNFAQGALRAARYVAQQPPGEYDMQGLLGL